LKYEKEGEIRLEETMNNKDEFQQEIEELKQKYETLFNEVRSLKDNKRDMEELVQSVNKNVENVMNELNDLKNDYDINTSQNIGNDDKIKYSMKEMLVVPLRKIAVGTMQSAFLMMDKTVEGVSNAKEGLEDIIAEAQYQNKKKHAESRDNV